MLLVLKTSYVFLICCFLYASNVFALETLSLDIKQIISKDWRLNNISFTLSGLHDQSQKTTLSIEQLSLPEPFDKLTFLNVKCSSFNFQETIIVCNDGKAFLDSKALQLSPFDFSFSISEDKSSFNIKNFFFAKGSLSLAAKQKGDSWTVTIKPEAINLKSLRSQFSNIKIPLDEISHGNITANIQLKGNTEGLNQFISKAFINHLTLQANNGQIATESLNINSELTAKFIKGKWHWQNISHVKNGEIYVDPVYLEAKDKGINIISKGHWNEANDLTIHQLNYSHSKAINLIANGLLKVSPKLFIDKALIKLDITDLGYFSKHYISPFIEQTPVENIKLKGLFESNVSLKNNEITLITSHFKNLTAIEDNKRFMLLNAQGEIHWSPSENFKTPSFIYWEELKIRAIPIDSGKLQFLLANKNIRLLQQTSLSLLDGELHIKNFNIQNQTGDDPNVFFEGGIEHISLEKLTQAFDWIPLSGNITGYIPGVNYENKKLTIDGELLVNVFDGTISINQLSSSGIFTEFSRFHLNLEFENLDLQALTQKFQIGAIEGRLSGYIHDLYLENWDPVSFHAWLGTPEDDDSTHRISQKAVENIASIGGGGVADIFSKGFLRFFDTFGYDRLGFGCFLKDGVCQLMGVEAAEHGYYIIKGGGLPRIDVTGYNTRLDWKILVESLSRISMSDDIIVD